MTGRFITIIPGQEFLNLPIPLHFKARINGRESLTTQLYFQDEDPTRSGLKGVPNILILNFAEDTIGDGQFIWSAHKTIVLDIGIHQKHLGDLENINPEVLPASIKDRILNIGNNTEKQRIKVAVIVCTREFMKICNKITDVNQYYTGKSGKGRDIDLVGENFNAEVGSLKTKITYQYNKDLGQLDDLYFHSSAENKTTLLILDRSESEMKDIENMDKLLKEGDFKFEKTLDDKTNTVVYRFD